MKKSFYKKWWFWLFSILIITSIGIIVFLNYTKETKIKTTKEPIDKKIYQQELKSQIDFLTTEYDNIVEQEWLPAWTELNSNPNHINTVESLDKMNNIANHYKELATKMDAFQAENNMNDPNLKKKMNSFRKEFIAASNYMGNAALSVIQSYNDGTPLDDSIHNAKESLGLADQHIVIALSTLNEMEEILRITKK
ncbi:hypothetical protein KFD70_00180 [Bacillus pfraonensis]|uniref:hypothetical protein n=1 Tax=Bacillus TaxID=1386 RepID=UPI002A55C838|nr:hypothetical protein [Bacillus pseudomycoides]